MITARLNGGLGNQMFQVATTSVLAWDNHDACAFNFSLSPVYQGNVAKTYRHSIFRGLNELPAGWKPRVVYREPSYDYAPIPYARNMELIGYFSGEKYIQHHKQDIVRLFSAEGILSRLREQYGDILGNSVSLHVRRGDYFKFDDVYVILGHGYYDKAIKIIDALASIDNILVFSDDMEWCENNLNDPRMRFMRGNLDFIDLYLMSLCNHNIMANSSFSWWGSYLNINPDKIVVAPQKWFGSKGPRHAAHLFCDNWIIL